jgi:hypothetical protein
VQGGWATEDPGACGAVLLHDPDLRPRRPDRLDGARGAGLMLRRALARALRALATRLEPGAPPAAWPAATTGSVPPVPVG